MTDHKKQRPVPTSRLGRVGRLGVLAGKLAGNVVTSGAEQWLKGNRPQLKDLVLTPSNITRITDQLATMRGAAMKVGQLLSMDAGDFLPKELADILGKLRDDADAMPKAQLQEVLDSEWGNDWNDDLLYFSFAPVAAASIGQVHKAITLEGRMLAIKIQYPGIKKSIDSDVNNVATLIKLAGVVPKTLDTQSLLNEAKTQLHQEADYQREAKMLSAYAANLEGSEHFVVPSLAPELTTMNVLAMDFTNGVSIDALIDAPQETRNTLMTALMTLFFDELFAFKLLQSDPNLANYLYQPDTAKIVLLDFGATRVIPDEIAQGYQALLIAAYHNDHEAMKSAALAIGLILPSHTTEQIDAVVSIGMLACEAIRADASYDFGESDLVTRLHDCGMALTYELNFWHTPPADAIFIHRKLGGLFLLAKRLKAQVDMKYAAGAWLADTDQ